MKSLRRSFKESARTQISTPLPLPTVSKPSNAVAPPQKVIRALSLYRPQAPQELPFQKGDFFYVLKDSGEQGDWYEAYNPVSGARGLVPRSMFEEFGRSLSLPGQKTPSTNVKLSPAHLSPNPSVSTSASPPAPRSPRSQVFYAVVLHDFIAERADELDARRGDSISVVAQSNREWFVGKPIGRLGRPGLIPVSFVEIRNPATGEPLDDIEGLMDRGDLPKVEDWKRSMLEYKQNSIALGVIEEPSTSANSKLQQPGQTPVEPTPESQTQVEALPPGVLLSANVVSFHYEMEEYWFRVDAIFQPDPAPGKLLPPAKQLVLFRVYNDFYDFQVSLLDTFPREAGREPPHPRILPYMPGPVNDVDDSVTANRRSELDDFLQHLCELNLGRAKHILRDLVVREFLALKPGDVQNSIEPRQEEIDALNKEGEESTTIYEQDEGEDYQEVQNSLGSLNLSRPDDRYEGSEYEDEGYATSPRRSQEAERHPYANDYNYPQEKSGQVPQRIPHHRANSAASFNRSNGHSASRSNSPMVSNHNRTSGYRYSEYDNEREPSVRSSAAPSVALSARSRNGSTNAKVNTPPISAANPKPAFVKIKVFDRVSDDVIALRVHPRISHAELIQKVQARLGGEVVNLRYRNSGVSSSFIDVDSDDSLQYWLESTEKYVLYAD